MARAILETSGKKRVSRNGSHVTAVIGVVSGNEYYELAVNAYDGNGEAAGQLIVTKTTSKDPTPKEVYRVPRPTKVRKTASKEPAGEEAPGLPFPD